MPDCPKGTDGASFTSGSAFTDSFQPLYDRMLQVGRHWRLAGQGVGGQLQVRREFPPTRLMTGVIAGGEDFFDEIGAVFFLVFRKATDQEYDYLTPMVIGKMVLDFFPEGIRPGPEMLEVDMPSRQVLPKRGVQEAKLHNPADPFSHQQPGAPLRQFYESLRFQSGLMQPDVAHVFQESGDESFQRVLADGFRPLTVQAMGYCGQQPLVHVADVAGSLSALFILVLNQFFDCSPVKPGHLQGQSPLVIIAINQVEHRQHQRVGNQGPDVQAFLQNVTQMLGAFGVGDEPTLNEVTDAIIVHRPD